MVDICVKFNYDRLRSEKALGNLRNLMTTRRTRTTFAPLGDPLRVQNQDAEFMDYQKYRKAVFVIFINLKRGQWSEA